MNESSILFYFGVMVIFVLEGWALSIALPFHSRVDDQELSSNRLIPLDGLRGILALSVFFTHASSYYYFERTNIWEYPPSNFYAQMAFAPVSMFFYITGYLFWSKLIRRPKFPAWRFWIGRFGRLVPAYGFACLCTFLFVAYTSGFHLRVPIGKLLKQLASWLAFAGTMDLNGVIGSNLWLGAAWSLRFEWLFYFSLPFLGWFARKSRTTLLLVFMAMGAGLFLHSLRLDGLVGHALSFSFMRYVDFFAYTFSIGILVARLPLERFAQWAQGRVATAISIAAILITLLWVPPKYGLLESACLAFPFACICLGNTWGGLLSSKAMRFLGRISYSFYLLHYLGLTIALSILKQRGLLAAISPLRYWMIVCAIGMAVIFVCAFSCQWLETPFLHVGQRRYAEATPSLVS